LGCTNELSHALQRKNQNIVRAISLIVVAKQNVQHLRDNEYEELLKEVKSFCMNMKISVPNMDDKISTRGKSRHAIITIIIIIDLGLSALLLLLL
jgi:Na+-transporting NADH:ubiquinone oxidoreductase subunit NqrF